MIPNINFRSATIAYDAEGATGKFVVDMKNDVFEVVREYNDVVSYGYYAIRTELFEVNNEEIYKQTNTHVKYIDGITQEECSICHEEACANVETVCSHFYCERCFIEWFLTRKHRECGMCRRDLFPNYQASITIYKQS
jgi:hypothetical protein